MYLLIVRDPEGNETEYDLIGEAVLGRDDSSDIRMPSSELSRRHARLFLDDGLCYVEDLGSSNGTFLDGEAVVGQVVLEPGRVLTLGPYEVWVEDPQGDEVSQSSGVAESLKGSREVEGDTGRWAASPASSASSSLLGSLEGISGAAFGQVFEVRDGATIGRLQGVEIIVEDPSMSRRHAEVHLVDGAVLVRDLESANGTFVNEQPIDEQELMDGDLVTFGSVAFRFSLAPETANRAFGALTPSREGRRLAPRRGGSGRGGSGGGMPARRKLLFVVAGVFVVLMVVLVAVGGEDAPASRSGSQSSTVDGGAGELPADLRAEVFSLMRRGQMLVDSEQWTEADDVFARAIELDPINAEARSSLNQVRLEGEMQSLFEEGNRMTQLGSLEDALEIYMEISPESAYRRRARFQVHQIVERLKGMYDGECRGFVRARQYERALVPCRRYMDFACQCPETINDRTKTALERAEQRARVPRSERWRCPTGIEEWVPCASRRVVTSSDDPEPLIAKQYPDKAVADAVVSYYGGQVDEALRALRRLEEDRSTGPDVSEQARRLRRQMQYVHGKSRQLQTELMRGALDQASAEWEDIEKTDSEILPDSIHSFIKRDAARRLSGAYHDRGVERQQARRLPEAFNLFRQGHQVNPDDTRIAERFRQLERQGLYNLRRAQTCGQLREVLMYTVDDPPSAAHQEAKRLIADRGC